MGDSNVISSVESDIGSFVSGLAVAVNRTYSYASGASFFAASMPSYMKDYADRYLTPAIQWLDGYVPYWHDNAAGILSTRLAARLITGLTKQVVGERVVFEYKAKDNRETSDTLRFTSTWAKESKAHKAVYSAIGWALAIGTSLLKANITADSNIWWEACRLDNCAYLTDFRGDVIEATFKIRGYTDTRNGHNNEQFYLTEHRYYETAKQGKVYYDKATGKSEPLVQKGQRTAMVEYAVHRTNGTMQKAYMRGEPNSIPWDNVPANIREAIKRDYRALVVGKPMKIGLTTLGVEVLTNGNIDLAVPNGANLGESLIVPIEADIITYELAYSCRIRDMHLGKGKVYVPKSLSMGDLGGVQTAKGGILGPMPGENSPVEMVKGLDPEGQKAIVQQFQLRAEEWQRIIDDSLKAIAVKWGMSPKILASYLAQGSAQQTATQIDSEDDMSIAFINLCRSYFIDPLNKLLETTMNFYGKAANVTMRFASPSLVNKDRLLKRVENELDKGLIDVGDAIRAMNPDLDEDSLRNKIEKAEKAVEAKAKQMADLDPFENLPEQDLSGTSSPATDKA